MGRIVVVTDSAACLPPELVQEHGIYVVPFALIFGRRVYRDGVDVSTAQFYRMLEEASELPTTSQPSVGDFLAVYRALRGEVEGIVSIHVPVTFSGTYHSALAAAHLMPELPVRVLDCGTAAMAQGFVVLAAARVAATGAELDQVVAVAEAVSQRVQLYATLGTLKYLARSGRVPALIASAGSALSIQPVLRMGQGRVDVVARVRTKGRAIAYMLDQMAAQVRDRPVHVAVFHAAVPNEAEALRRAIGERFRCLELYTTEFTPVMGAHTGPGVVGLAYYIGDEGPVGQEMDKRSAEWR